jgi:hypothetical protein
MNSSYWTEVFEGSGHGPLFGAADRWRTLFFDFLASADRAAPSG